MESYVNLYLDYLAIVCTDEVVLLSPYFRIIE